MSEKCECVNVRKVVIVGCGFVGSASAFALMQSGLFSEMVLIDVDKDRAEGEAMDISHGASFAGPMKIYAGGYEDVGDAAIIVITAGANQKPNETRLDLVQKNAKIMADVVTQIKEQEYKGILLIVSNPVDIMTQVAMEVSGFPEHRVFGSGTVLDSARLRYHLGQHLGVDSRSVHAFVIGEHGEYALEDVVLSMPAIVGARGIETTIPISLDEKEVSRLHESAEMLRETRKEIR